MIAGWKEKIEAAQTITHETLRGARFRRVAYGTEVANPQPHCRDCGVSIGQLHVPDCCVERCGRCKGQAIACSCPTDDD